MTQLQRPNLELYIRHKSANILHHAFMPFGVPVSVTRNLGFGHSSSLPAVHWVFPLNMSTSCNKVDTDESYIPVITGPSPLGKNFAFVPDSIAMK